MIAGVEEFALMYVHTDGVEVRRGLPEVRDARRPAIDGTAGHAAHADLARKARSEFRRHSHMPAWCLPRSIHQRRENPRAVLADQMQ